MKAGKRRHYITVQRVSSTQQNTYGEIEEAWNNDFNTFAEIKPMRGKEYYNSRQIQSICTHKIIFAYREFSTGGLITPDDSRIIFNSRVFNIESIININERNIDLEIMAVEEL